MRSIGYGEAPGRGDKRETATLHPASLRSAALPRKRGRDKNKRPRDPDRFGEPELARREKKRGRKPHRGKRR
jgi:hypothetical protein